MTFQEILLAVRAGLDYQLFRVGGQWITPATLLLVALVLALAWALSKFIQRGLARLFERRAVGNPGTTALVLRIVHYVVMGLGLAVALQTIGIELATLFAAGAIFAIAVGFAMQNIAENFVSGLLLLGERAIKPGDVLEVEGTVVRVVHMGIRSTVARTRDEEDLIIPNSKLVQGMVKNYTLRDPLFRVSANVGVSYSSDMRQVMRVLEAAAESVPGRHATPPAVVMRDFGDSSVNFAVRIWVEDPWTGPALLSELNERIWFALKDAGITIAFPQLDLHVMDVPPALSAGTRDGR